MMTDIDTDELADKIAARLAERLDDRPLLRMNEAAERLNVSRRYLEKMLQRGELPFVTIAGGRRVEAAELDRYIAGRREGP